MRTRAFKAFLIAIGVLVAQWAALPHVRPRLAQQLVYRDSERSGLLEDGRALTTASLAGIHEATIVQQGVPNSRSRHSLTNKSDVDPVKSQIAADNWMLPEQKHSDADVCDTWAIGWPMPMFRKSWYQYRNTSEPTPYRSPFGGKPVLFVFVGEVTFDGMRYPISPLWGGLSFNLMVWWAVWFGILSIPLRPWLRRRKGHCPKCSYDLKKDFGGECPECGWGRAREA